MQEDHQERAEPGEPQVAVAVLHARGERDAFEQAVQREPERGAAPGDVVPVMVVARLLVLVDVAGGVGFDVVVVEAEEPLDEEHRRRSRRPSTAARSRSAASGVGLAARRFGQRVRQHVQHADAEHHRGDEADGDLHPAVREPNPLRNHPADDRRGDDQQAVVGERNDGGDQEGVPTARPSTNRDRSASMARPLLES